MSSRRRKQNRRTARNSLLPGARLTKPTHSGRNQRPLGEEDKTSPPTPTLSQNGEDAELDVAAEPGPAHEEDEDARCGRQGEGRAPQEGGPEGVVVVDDGVVDACAGTCRTGACAVTPCLTCPEKEGASAPLLHLGTPPLSFNWPRYSQAERKRGVGPRYSQAPGASAPAQAAYARCSLPSPRYSQERGPATLGTGKT